MLGQIRVEFIIGMMIFALVMFFIVTQTNTLFSSLLSDSRADSLKAKAANSIKILVEDKGDPPIWDINVSQGQLNAVKRVGLADQPYSLNKNKVLNLSQNCTSATDLYKTLLWNFDLKAYRLKIYNSTNRILFCGFDSLEPPVVVETRYIFIDTDFGNLTLELW